MAGIASLTKPDAVLQAMPEYDGCRREALLREQGFGRAKLWYVINDGKQYDSKAVVGAATGIETGHSLPAADCHGGEGSAVRKLRSPGFRVIHARISEEAPHLPGEVPNTFPEGMRSSVIVNRAERSAAVGCLS